MGDLWQFTSLGEDFPAHTIYNPSLVAQHMCALYGYVPIIYHMNNEYTQTNVRRCIRTPGPARTPVLTIYIAIAVRCH